MPNASSTEAEGVLSTILENDSLEGGVDFFIYLLGNYEKVKNMPDEERKSFPNRFQHILYVFERDGLSTADIEVISYKPVEPNILFGEKQITSRYGYPIALYEFNVLIHDGGFQCLSEGKAMWLGGFIEDNYQYIDFVLPYGDAVNRLEADLKFPEESARIGDIAYFFYSIVFASPEEIPVEKIIFYLLCQDVSEDNIIDKGDYYGTIMSQEEIDARANKYFNLDHVDGKETSFYIEEKGFYYMPSWGTGGPLAYDILKVEKNSNVTYIYFDGNGYVSDCLIETNGMNDRKILKYTFVDNYLQSAEEVVNSAFSPVILVGENG